MKSFELNPICTIETPFTEKFGIPRQSMLIPEAQGIMEFPKNDFYAEAFRGIEGFSHLWLIFSFHEAITEGHKALVRPPRFLGKEKWGVFATRSPHRPNHLGQSVVKFKSIVYAEKKIVLTVEGVDLLNGTPIFDIKPYIPYADSFPEASALHFETKPPMKVVKWESEWELDDQVKSLIEKVIGLDPRPGFDQNTSFGVSVAGYNVRFKFIEEEFVIEKVSKEQV